MATIVDRVIDTLMGPVPMPRQRRRPYGRPRTTSHPRLTRRAGNGGRLSSDEKGSLSNLGMTLKTVAPPPSWEKYWAQTQLDATSLEDMPPPELLQVLADLSPDVSRALWDFLRFANPGYEIKVYEPGEKKTDHTQGQAVVDAFMQRLEEQHGAVDVLWSRLYINAFLRGAMLMELVLDESASVGIDLAVPDAKLVRFERRTDPVRGPYWQVGQSQGGRFVAFDRPTIRYIPVDPFPDSPYGRPMASPALFTTLFALGMMHDLRRVIQQQGWPRIDIAIALDKLESQIPEDIQGDSEAELAFLESVIQQIGDAFADLGPDDAYVHPDSVTVNRPVGAADAFSLGAVGTITSVLERMAVRSLKTMPLTMGITDGVSEANANRQWEINAAGIKAIQHLAENGLSAVLRVMLEAGGIQATVEVRFAELRASEMMRDAQTEQLTIANAVEKRNQNFIDQNRASNLVTGEDAVGPAPSIVAPGEEEEEEEPADDAADVEAEPGSNREVPA